MSVQCQSHRQLLVNWDSLVRDSIGLVTDEWLLISTAARPENTILSQDFPHVCDPCKSDHFVFDNFWSKWEKKIFWAKISISLWIVQINSFCFEHFLAKMGKTIPSQASPKCVTHTNNVVLQFLVIMEKREGKLSFPRFISNFTNIVWKFTIKFSYANLLITSNLVLVVSFY